MCPDGLISDIQPDSDFSAANDSLYVMPMEIVPFETPALSRGRLRMNSALEHVIDIFTDETGNNGFLPVSAINQNFGLNNFGWPADRQDHPDIQMLKKLSQMTSFDVYSLRILFKAQDIDPAIPDALQLSKQAKDSLSAYLKRFTAPLILNVYGDVSLLASADDPIELFRNPDRQTIANNLKKIADSLGTTVESIPRFLEQFSECYLSISYFERYLHSISPEVGIVAGELAELKKHRSLADEFAMQEKCEQTAVRLEGLTASAMEKIERFHMETNSMWSELTAERFYRISRLVKSYQVSVAGVLCGLGIKMTEWRRKFPTPKTGSPNSRAEILVSSLAPGLEKLVALDNRVDLPIGRLRS